MTTIETQLPRPFLARVAAVARAVGEGYIRMGERSRLGACARKAGNLFALSDADLAARGLTRDKIIPHVFGGYYGY